MRRTVLVTLICLAIVGLPVYGSPGALPIIDGKMTVATVNGEPITADEFNKAIEASHIQRSGKEKAGRIDYSSILDRLINTRLILLEARNMGLHELPEVRSATKEYSRETLMKQLLERQVEDVRVDEAEVEKVYRESTKEWKIKSATFKKEEDAKRVAEDIQASDDFDKIVSKAVEDGVARESGEAYLKNKDLKPIIARQIANMEVGSVSPVISFGGNDFVVFKLEEKRFAQEREPESWAKAEKQVLYKKKADAAKTYYNDLVKRYVKVNTEVLDGLDYESEEPGLQKLSEDQRIVAEIEGEEPITVGELTKALRAHFYHGIEKAITSKSVNFQKYVVLGKMLEKRVLIKEALKQGIDRSATYSQMVEEYEKSLIFELFVNKVIIPAITVDIKEIKNYYKKNKQEFSSPPMMRIESLVFGQKSYAADALEKLSKGSDFNWMRSHAVGQVDANREGLLKFEGKLLTIRSLPEDLQKAVGGTNEGDYRLYTSPEGYFYVLYIYEMVPAKPRPLANVKKEITEKIFENKVKSAIEDYAAKLREYYPVKIYAKKLR
jgi:hypothetical protein